MKTKRKFTVLNVLFMAVGLIMLVYALFRLNTAVNGYQYVIAAPASSEDDAARKNLIESLNSVSAKLTDTLVPISMAAKKDSASISKFGDNSTQNVSLYAFGERWYETCPRPVLDGRWADASEIRNGYRVAMLDEDLAFKLFSSGRAVGENIDINGQRYTVIGTVRHNRYSGETSPYSVYIPYQTAVNEKLELDTVTAYMSAAAGEQTKMSFESEIRNAWGSGAFYNLDKQIIGASVLPRFLAFGTGMVLLFWLFRISIRQFKKHAAIIREWLKDHYFKEIMLSVLWRGLVAIIIIILLLSALYGLFAFLIEPVYTYTEWVPSSLVEWPEIEKVFWNLTSEASKSITLKTAEVSRIEFLGFLCSASTVLILFSIALGFARKVKTADRAKNAQNTYDRHMYRSDE